MICDGDKTEDLLNMTVLKKMCLENINLTVELSETVLCQVFQRGEKHPAFYNKRCYSVR